MMRIRNTFATVLLAVMATSVFSRPAPVLAADTLTVTAGAAGVFNGVTSNITHCTPAVTAFGDAPSGKCGGIGGIPANQNTGHPFVVYSGANPPVAFVGDTISGYIVECTLLWNVNTGYPMGGCVPVANPIR